MEEGGIVEGLGKTSWAGAEGERHELTIKIGMTLRKIIRQHEDSERVGSNVLHVLLHGMSTQHNGFTEV